MADGPCCSWVSGDVAKPGVWCGEGISREQLFIWWEVQGMKERYGPGVPHLGTMSSHQTSSLNIFTIPSSSKPVSQVPLESSVYKDSVHNVKQRFFSFLFSTWNIHFQFTTRNCPSFVSPNLYIYSTVLNQSINQSSINQSIRQCVFPLFHLHGLAAGMVPFLLSPSYPPHSMRGSCPTYNAPY